ncbi:cupin domain-containing protein [Rhodococcus sp. NPDC056960]|uniref:cupin domain-containing protein n=1 Tax=Rhodococcus sp. NPDC056960 TaxID=3345982 RepID=UPI00362E3754
MDYVRKFDDEKAFDTGFPGYRAQFLSSLESTLFIHSVIQQDGCGPGLHYHHSDQLYFLLEGTMNVQLGEDVTTAGRGSLVFIPAGLPHRNWNDGPGTERHFEMIIPRPGPGAPLAYPVDSPSDVPEDRRATQRAYIRQIDESEFVEPMSGFRLQPLADPSTGSLQAVVNYAEVDSGSAGPGMHIHPFDQFYLVLEGELTVEVALEKHTVGEGALVVLPAGVPHRQYNSSSATERHLVVLSPTPVEGVPWDEGVDFVSNGETHNGPNSLTPAEPVASHVTR